MQRYPPRGTVPRRDRISGSLAPERQKSAQRSRNHPSPKSERGALLFTFHGASPPVIFANSTSRERQITLFTSHSHRPMQLCVARAKERERQREFAQADLRNARTKRPRAKKEEAARAKQNKNGTRGRGKKGSCLCRSHGLSCRARK